MLRFSLSLFSLLILLTSNLGWADGNNLLSMCSPILKDSNSLRREDNFGLGFCLGMMQGFTGMNQAHLAIYNKSLVCLPKDGIKNGQAARIVVKYLEEHPESLHEEEIILTLKAFLNAYPCNN